MDNIEILLMQILEGQNKTNERLEKLEQKVDNIETKLNSVFNQTANLTEFQTELNGKLTCIENSVNTIKDEVVKGQEAYNILQGFKNVFAK